MSVAEVIAAIDEAEEAGVVPSLDEYPLEPSN
jgi:hypothetical protein